MPTFPDDDPLVRLGLRASVPILLDIIAVRRCHEVFNGTCPQCRATANAEPTVAQCWGVMRPSDGALQNAGTEELARRMARDLRCHVVTWWEAGRSRVGRQPRCSRRSPARGPTRDVAAAPHNAKCPRYFTRDDDGLAQSWAGERVWCNPPFSDLRPWVVKAWQESRGCPVIVMLLPANRCEQRWWQELVEPFRDRPGSPLRTTFLPGRPRFDLLTWEQLAPDPDPGDLLSQIGGA